jgi:hypothetical protein
MNDNPVLAQISARVGTSRVLTIATGFGISTVIRFVAGSDDVCCQAGG